MAKKRTLPRYMQRYERPWFRKGKAAEFMELLFVQTP